MDETTPPKIRRREGNKNSSGCLLAMNRAPGSASAAAPAAASLQILHRRVKRRQHPSEHVTKLVIPRLNKLNAPPQINP